LKKYDYTQPGAYFVTVVAYHRIRLFSEVVGGEMRLNQFGEVVVKTWEFLPNRYSYVSVDPYAVMPNHFHGILSIEEINDPCRGGSRPAPTTKIKPLGELIGAFKTVSAKNINIIRGLPGHAIWQRNYYEHIVRDQSELENISLYITSNPATWQDDPEYIP